MLLPPWPLFSAFMVASIVLAVTPGPGVFYIVSRAAAQGRRYGVASVLGVAAGNLTNAVAAAFGLAARHARHGQRATGMLCIGLGLFTAISGQNQQPTTTRG